MCTVVETRGGQGEEEVMTLVGYKGLKNGCLHVVDPTVMGQKKMVRM